MPNQDKIDLTTKAARQPIETALQSNGNVLEQHATNAVSKVQSALQQALNVVSQSDAATNSRALEETRKQLSQAVEYLDQAETSTNAMNLPNQI